MLVGTYEAETPLDLQVGSLTGEQSVLTSRYCTLRDVSDVLRMVAHGTVKPFVTQTVPLEEGDEVLEAIVRKEVAGRAVAVIDPA